MRAIANVHAGRRFPTPGLHVVPTPSRLFEENTFTQMERYIATLSSKEHCVTSFSLSFLFW